MLTLVDPELFLVSRRSHVTPRTARLLACALARHHWHLLTDAGRAAVLVAEQHADNLATDDILFSAWMTVDSVRLFAVDAEVLAAEAALCATCEIADPSEYVRGYVLDLAADLHVEAALLVAWMDCLLAEPVALPQTATVASLARAIREEQAWSRLPVLADAAEEAGCTDAALLAHLRGPGPHCRGCYAVGDM